MEESILRTLQADELLHVIHDEHIDALVEVHKVIEDIMVAGIRELHHEEVGAQVEHTLLRMQLLGAHADGIHQVRLAHTAGTVDEERVESHLLGVLCNSLAHAARQFVARALDEVVEVLVQVELRIQVCSHSYSLSQHGRLVRGEFAWCSLYNHVVVALLIHCHIVGHFNLV